MFQESYYIAKFMEKVQVKQMNTSTGFNLDLLIYVLINNPIYIMNELLKFKEINIKKRREKQIVEREKE